MLMVSVRMTAILALPFAATTEGGTILLNLVGIVGVIGPTVQTAVGVTVGVDANNVVVVISLLVISVSHDDGGVVLVGAHALKRRHQENHCRELGAVWGLVNGCHSHCSECSGSHSRWPIVPVAPPMSSHNLLGSK